MREERVESWNEFDKVSVGEMVAQRLLARHQSAQQLHDSTGGGGEIIQVQQSIPQYHLQLLDLIE